jgi:quinoprotein glucose dehydrogenase
MATKTLVVMGDPQLTTTPEHPRGAMLRAYDKTNGNQVGMVHMPAPQSGSPMTYLAGGVSTSSSRSAGATTQASTSPSRCRGNGPNRLAG